MRRTGARTALAALALAVGGAALLTGSPSAAQSGAGPQPGVRYRLHTVFRGPGECLEGNRADSPNHSGASFMDRCQNVTGQAWLFEPAGNGYFHLKTMFQGANKCLESNRADSPSHGGGAFLDDCQNVTGQLWRVVADRGRFRLQSAFRGTGECLEGNRADSPSHAGGAFMDRCQNVSGQLWILSRF